MMLTDYVENRIDEIFNDIAEQVGNGELCEGFTEDELAGVPMMLISGNMHLRTAWRNYIRKLEKADAIQS